MRNSKHQWDKLWFNATLCCGDGIDNIIHHGAIAISDGKIVWLGKQQDLPAQPSSLASDCQDCRDKIITPGLIDCHTHLVYAGNRANEFTQRLQGMSYSEIAKAGGGIKATVLATRAASEQQLYDCSLPRLQALIHEGVTTVEIKSGYGLDLVTELKILRVARQLGRDLGIRVKTTFLGAHAIPPEYIGNAAAYIEYVCTQMLPQVAEQQLADAVDVFCENIAFNLAQATRVFQTAKSLGLAIKCHAEQLSAMGASELAAANGALSCDHLEYLTEAGVAAMATAGSVAVLLPGAFYYLGETHAPPINLLRQYQVPIAIATDSNPGTSPTTSLLLMLNMACILWGLTPHEALCAVTANAARALGIAQETGSLAVGKAAELVIWECQDISELSYYIGFNLGKQVVSR